MLTNNIKSPSRSKEAITAMSLRLLLFVTCLLYLSLSSAYGQTSQFSDHYVIDNHGGVPGTDPETGEPTIAIPENDVPPEIVGVGYSEAAYDSPYTWTEAYTILSNSSGAITVNASASGYSRARAEAISIELKAGTSEEGEYLINSEHRYYVSQGGSYDVVTTFWGPSARVIYSGHQLLFGSNVCRNTYGLAFPYTNLKVCNDGPSGCPFPFRICTSYPSTFTQCTVWRVDYGFGFYDCYFPRCFPNGSTPPLCRN